MTTIGALRSIMIAALVLLSFCAQAQVINADRVTARSRLTVAGTEIDSISVDSTFSAASARKVPTSGAVKAFVESIDASSQADSITALKARVEALESRSDTLPTQGYVDSLNTAQQAEIDGKIDSVQAGSNISITGSGTNADPFVFSSTGSGAFARDSLSASPLWVTLVRSGGDTTALLSNPAAGRYHIDIPENGSFVSASLFGNNATLSGSNELEIQIDNTANGYKQRLMVQVYDANTGGLVNQFITGTNHTQTVAGFVTTIKLPGMNGFGATGYLIEIR